MAASNKSNEEETGNLVLECESGESSEESEAAESLVVDFGLEPYRFEPIVSSGDDELEDEVSATPSEQEPNNRLENTDW